MRIIFFVIPFAIASVLFSCNQRRNADNNPAKTQVKPSVDTTVDDSLVGTIDNIAYTDSNTIYHPMGDGDGFDSVLYYLDTFSVAGNQFRLVYEYPKNGTIEAILEQHKQNNWIIENVFYMDPHGQTIKHNRDIDGDGCTDITVSIRFHNDVYLFNPNANEFYNNDSCVVYDKVYTLDKYKKIYCDIHEFKGLCGDVNTDLFTLRNNTRINLYSLQLFNCPDTGYDFNLITKLVLQKHYPRKKIELGYDNDSLEDIKTIPLAKPIDMYKYDDEVRYKYFDHIAYWKSCYKELLKP